MLNRPEPAPALCAGIAPSASFIRAGTLAPIISPRKPTRNRIQVRDAAVSSWENSTTATRLPTSDRVAINRGSTLSIRRPEIGEASMVQPKKARVTMPNWDALPPGRVLMKKAREYTRPLLRIIWIQ